LSNITKCVSSVLPNAIPVRAVAFNKHQNENWAVSWHQDRLISVREKHDVKGYLNWSCKSGLWHCEPPVEILKNMLAVRIHLDDSNSQSGGLEISKASHKFGKVPANKIREVVQQSEPILCNAETGDILIMKMLTLHRSKPLITDTSRRAIRIDYSAKTLPMLLQWEKN